MTKDMSDALSMLYQGTSKKQNMRCMKMQKGEGINPFLTRLQEVRDQLSAVGATRQPS